MSPILQHLFRSFRKLGELLSLKDHGSTMANLAPAVHAEQHMPPSTTTQHQQVVPTVQLPIYSSQNMETFRTIHNEESFNSTISSMPAGRFQNLPISILTRILGCILASDKPLILQLDSQTPDDYRTHLHPQVLASCRLLYHVGMPILYGSNVITTSSSATSKDFDKQLLNLPGKYRQLIKHVKLEIDWADRLWENFPLIARVLGEIVGLKSLEILITAPVQRAGAAAEMMLKVEKKTFMDMAVDLKGLQVLRLEGYQDRRFAKSLEAWIKRGRVGQEVIGL